MAEFDWLKPEFVWFKPQKLGLSDLPADVLNEIASYLSCASHLALSMTSEILHAKVEHPRNRLPSGAKQKWYNMADLLEIEMWPAYDSASYRSSEIQSPIDSLDHFACHLCLKIRSAGNFSNAMMKGKRGKLGLGTILDKSRRSCIQCGVAHRRILPGTSLRFGGLFGGYGYVCRRCGMFKNEIHNRGGEPARRICAACFPSIAIPLDF